MTEASLLERALRLCRRHDPDPELLRLLVRLRQAATVLLFIEAVRCDQYGLAHWAVGDPDTPTVFAAKSSGMRALFLLAKDKAVSVELVSDAGCEAARKVLKRAITELARHAPALADELRAFTIENGVVRYRPRGDSPRILTERGGIAAASSPFEKSEGMMDAHLEPGDMTWKS